MAPARLVRHPQREVAWLAALAGCCLGLLIGIPLCVIRDSTDPVVRHSGDIPVHVGVASLGVIPHARVRRLMGSGRPLIDLNPSKDGEPGGVPLFAGGFARRTVALHAGGLAESFRHLLASIWIAGQNQKRPRVMLVTSASTREGKTTVAVNLGIALANTNRRVLIVDAHLRHPQIHSIFAAPANWGLANVLEQSAPIEDYGFDELFFKTEVPGLYVLPAGTGKLAIADLRNVERLTDLLLRFRLEFHAVLVDTPAASVYPEARVLARLSDAVLLVLRADSTARRRAEALARQLKTDGAKLLGAVLNDCRRP